MRAQLTINALSPVTKCGPQTSIIGITRSLLAMQIFTQNCCPHSHFNKNHEVVYIQTDVREAVL